MFPEGRAIEFLIVAAVALIFVGPKDLPVLLRKLGQFMAKIRGMAAEFRASFDEMARQSELDELRKEVEAMRQGQMADIAASTTGGLTNTVDEIGRELSDGVQTHPPMSYQYTPPEPEAAPAAKAPRARKAAGSKTGAATKPTTKSAKSPTAAKLAAAKSAPAKPTPAKSRARKPASAKT
jgi:sec-independent protein translocase protein TatB